MAKSKVTLRFSDEAVKAKTGKIWVEWFQILNRAGARKMAHPEIANYLHNKRGVPGWWAQMVANQYEQAHGMRSARQSTDGQFAAGVSRTFEVPLAKLYSAWTDGKTRRRWLKDDRMEITTATKNKSIRAKWDGASRVSVMFYAKGAAKSQVVVDHMQLESAAESRRTKKFWAEAIDEMQKALG
jgi:hypothetical protein